MPPTPTLDSDPTIEDLFERARELREGTARLGAEIALLRFLVAPADASDGAGPSPLISLKSELDQSERRRDLA